MHTAYCRTCARSARETARLTSTRPPYAAGKAHPPAAGTPNHNTGGKAARRASTRAPTPLKASPLVPLQVGVRVCARECVHAYSACFASCASTRGSLLLRRRREWGAPVRLTCEGLTRQRRGRRRQHTCQRCLAFCPSLPKHFLPTPPHTQETAQQLFPPGSGASAANAAAGGSLVCM